MIEEAINYLRFIYSDRKDEGIGDDMPGQKAIQLGIEALERIKAIREAKIKLVKYNLCDHLLPSEGEKE